jgi:hypothetical protein
LNSTTWKNSTEITLQNTPPEKVVLTYPAAGQNITNRTPTYNWTVTTDIDSDTPIYYTIIISTYANFSDTVLNETTTDNYFAQPTELDFRPYYWKVIAYDGENYSAWSDERNFTVKSYVSVSLIQENVSFGQLNPNSSDDTTDDSPLPFIFRSQSNLYIKMINASANSSLWTMQPLNTSYWQFKVRSNGEDGSFNESSSAMAWINASDSMENLVRGLNYSTTRNNVSLDVGITAPMYEGPGTKSSTITFNWESDT